MPPAVHDFAVAGHCPAETVAVYGHFYGVVTVLTPVGVPIEAGTVDRDETHDRDILRQIRRTGGHGAVAVLYSVELRQELDRA